MVVRFRLNWSYAMSHLPGKKVWQIQERRGKSEKKRRWKRSETETTQPNQRPLQVRCNGKNARDNGKYTLYFHQKSNEIGQWTESISQKSPFCDLSDESTKQRNPLFCHLYHHSNSTHNC
jgi:hypothetical protein